MNWPLKIATHLVQLVTIAVILGQLFQRKAPPPYRLFMAGWALVLLFDLTMVLIGLYRPVNNHWLYNIAFPLQYLVVTWFFSVLTRRKRAWWLPLVFIAAACLNLLFIQGSETLNTYTLSLAGLLVFSLAITRMYELYREETERDLFSEPDFWYSTGFTLYCGLATPYFAMYNYLWQHFTRFTTFYFFTFNYGFAIILNLCIIRAALCRPSTRK